MTAETADLERLLGAAPLPERLAALHAAGLADESGLDRLIERAAELLHTDLPGAEQLLELCEAAAGGLDAPQVLARAHYTRARVCAERGEFDRAAELIVRARGEWLRAGDPLQALRTDLGRMQILDDLGRHREAVEVGEQLLTALDGAPGSGPDDAELRALVRAGALGNIGVAYSFVGEHERSLVAYADSEKEHEALGMRAQAAFQRANRGIELLALGRARAARDALRSARLTLDAEGDRMRSVKCAAQLAEAHVQLGEIVDALGVLDGARAAVHDLGAEAEAGRVELALSRTYLAAGLPGEAIDLAQAAVELTAGAGMEHDHGFATYALGLARTAVGDWAGAERDLRTAAALFEAVGDRQYQARTLLARADVAANRGAREQAQRLLDTAAALLRAGGWQAAWAAAQLRRADLADDPDAAHGALAEAGGLVASLGLPQLRYGYLLRLARVRRAQGYVEETEQLLLSAIDVMENWGSGLVDPLLRTAFRADKLAAHDELVDLLMTRGRDVDVVAAARTADRAKGQTLADLAFATLGRSSAQPPDELTARLADLSATYAALVEVDSPSRRRLVLDRVERLEREITMLRAGHTAAGESSAPRSAAVRPAPGGPALAYHVVGADVLAFVTDAASTAQARRLTGIRPAVRAEIARLVAQWQRFRVGPDFAARHAAALHETTLTVLNALYELLVAPVRDLLDACVADDLLIVPHRFLHGVPFHALHDGAGYLAERWTIALSPTLPVPAAAEAPRRDGLLVLAVPDERAPSIGAEADALRALVPGARVLVGAPATAAALRAGLPGPRFVHLACHGLYRAENPLFSAVHLADRWVTSAEVLDLRLDGALVTLSACESGRPAQDAPEPVGLAWAFLAAGASGAIVSQWVVDDLVATGLMPRLYTELCAGRPAPLALRRAQLAVAAEHPHPYFWAPFAYVASPTYRPDTGRS